MAACPLCGYQFDPTGLSCAPGCPLASLQGCHLICCPNCHYAMVDEQQSHVIKLMRRIWNGRVQSGATGEGSEQ